MTGIVATILLAMAGIGAAFNLVAALLVRKPKPLAARQAWPSVTVLKPLHGLEPGLEAKLEGLFAHGYPGAVQIVFGASSEADPALALARTIATRHPAARVAFASDAPRIGANAKLSNLANMAPAIAHEIVVIADSDVAWMPDTLARVVNALEQPGVGMISCLHIGRGDAGFWSRVAAMDISYRYMPSVVLGQGLGLAKPVLGPTMALRAEVLAQIGGFAAFTAVLADDYELGRAVRAMGLKTHVPDFFIIHGCTEPTLRALIRHELRWSVTIFRIDPAGFAGSVVTHATLLAVAAIAVGGAGPVALGVLGAALTARSAIKARIDRASGQSSGQLWLMPLRLVLSAVVFIATFFVNKVDWRGAEFGVTRDGRLQIR